MISTAMLEFKFKGGRFYLTLWSDNRTGSLHYNGIIGIIEILNIYINISMVLEAIIITLIYSIRLCQ